MEVDVRTPIEKARDEKHEKICNLYLKLTEENRDCKPHRIFAVIAREVCMTVPGVKNVIVQKGLYQTASKL